MSPSGHNTIYINRTGTCPIRTSDVSSIVVFCGLHYIAVVPTVPSHRRDGVSKNTVFQRPADSIMSHHVIIPHCLRTFSSNIFFFTESHEMRAIVSRRGAHIVSSAPSKIPGDGNQTEADEHDRCVVHGAGVNNRHRTGHTEERDSE